MKQIILIMLMFLMLVSCRSRKKALAVSEYRLAEVTKIDTNTVVSEGKKMQEIEKITQKTDQTESENDGDLTIKGKTDSLQDFTYHNIVNGDTLSDIRITGKADFIIKNRWKQSDKEAVKETVKEKINIVAEIARKSVSQTTIKDVAEKLRTKQTDVKTTGFSFWIYVIAGAAVLLLVLLFFLWNKFGGSIMERLNKKR